MSKQPYRSWNRDAAPIKMMIMIIIMIIAITLLMMIIKLLSLTSWNPEDSSTNDNEALLVEKEDSPPTVGVPEPERYLPRYNPQYFEVNTNTRG